MILVFVLLHLFTRIVWFSSKAEAWWPAAGEIVPVEQICRRKGEVVGHLENSVLGGLRAQLVLEVTDEGPRKSKLIRFC
jgi:hypothetical protein